MSVGKVNVAFWNVANLFEPGVVDRGPNSGVPRSPAELEAKIEVLASVIGELFHGESPDLLGLSEVGSLAILEKLVDRIASRKSESFVFKWIEPRTRAETGLALVARHESIPRLDLLEVEDRAPDYVRPRAAVFEVEIRTRREPVLFAIVHWKSRMVFGKSRKEGQNENEEDRKRSARWLADILGRYDRSACAIVVGDFNAEPFEVPFLETGLRSGRSHSSATHSSTRSPAYLYNTAWRFLCEPDYREDKLLRTYRESRPKTSHDASPPVMYDQLLVSGAELGPGPLVLIEREVRLHCDPPAGVVNSKGVLRPRRWDYDESAARGSGASDHFPLCASFGLE